MIALVTLGAVLLVLGSAVLIRGLITAPEGFEDESGFHPGNVQLHPLSPQSVVIERRTRRSLHSLERQEWGLEA